jgi:hypothetical protein
MSFTTLDDDTLSLILQHPILNVNDWFNLRCVDKRLNQYIRTKMNIFCDCVNKNNNSFDTFNSQKCTVLPHNMSVLYIQYYQNFIDYLETHYEDLSTSNGILYFGAYGKKVTDWTNDTILLQLLLLCCDVETIKKFCAYRDIKFGYSINWSRYINDNLGDEIEKKLNTTITSIVTQSVTESKIDIIQYLIDVASYNISDFIRKCCELCNINLLEQIFNLYEKKDCLVLNQKLYIDSIRHCSMSTNNLLECGNIVTMLGHKCGINFSSVSARMKALILCNSILNRNFNLVNHIYENRHDYNIPTNLSVLYDDLLQAKPPDYIGLCCDLIYKNYDRGWIYGVGSYNDEVDKIKPNISNDIYKWLVYLN